MRKLFNIEALAPILLIAAIFWIYPVADLSDPRFSAYFRFGACVFVFLIVLVWRVNKAVACFLALAGISSIYPSSTKYSQGALMAITMGVGWFYFVSRHANPQRIMDAIAIIGIANSLMALTQWAGLDPIFKPVFGKEHPIVGFLGNSNEVSALLAFCLPTYFRDKWKWFIPLIVLALFASHSTGGVVAAVVLIGAYFFIKDGPEAMVENNNGWKMIGVVAALVLFLSYADSQYSMSFGIRFFVWEKAVRMIQNNIFMGAGIGHWKVVWSTITVNGQWWKHAHNEYLQAVFEMGIGFVVCVMLYIVHVIKHYDKSKLIPATAIIAIAVNSTVNFPFHIAQTAAVAIAWMGIYDANCNA